MGAPGQVTPELGLAQQTCMVQGLRQWLASRQGVEASLIETHISYVLVCGSHAYKLKKALRTPFLDQSTLALRQLACQEELRLNRRMAAELYLGVVPVTGTAAAPELAGTGAAIDVAVKMRAFAQESLWDRLAVRGELGAAQVDELVRLLGPFHAAAAVAGPGGPLGSPGQVRAPVLQSLDELEALVGVVDGRALLGPLRAWEAVAFGRLQPVMAQRLAQGRVRECHGDLHLGNVTAFEGRTTVFDAIDFNDNFRWIDVMSEVAFMAMDLHAHGLAPLAHRFINGYLELSGDYAGVDVLNYGMVYRALVRAKVELLRAAQCAASEATDASAKVAAERAAARRYLDLALRLSRRERTDAVLMLTHGFSGSGKSTLTQGLLEAAGAIRIRADVERKRLAGLQALDRRSACDRAGLYSPEMTAVTYARLVDLAAAVLKGGHPVILDATFLRRAQRDAVRQLAAGLGVPCVILDFTADADVLRQRLRERAARGLDPSDADEGVLAEQIRTAEPLQPDEAALVFRRQTSAPLAGGVAEVDWGPLLQQLAAEGAPGP